MNLFPHPVITCPRCPEGQRLWEEIDRAKVGGNPGEIRRAVTAYFTHKNGGFSNRNKTKYEPPCLKCDERRQEANR